MKAFKRIAAFMLAMIMVFGLTMTASAETETTAAVEEPTTPATFKIEITAATDGSTVAGHTYNVYQIFKGDVAVDNTVEPSNQMGFKAILSNVVYGKNYGTENQEVPKAVLDKLAEMTGEAAAKELYGGLVKKDAPIAVLNNTNGFTTNQVAGYYLIVDVSTNLPEGATSSAFILQVVDNVTVESKHTSVPNVEKKIDDTNDSVDAEDEMDWQDSADHDIEDLIPFKLEMTVPANFSQFEEYGEKYRFVFHDTEEAGLTFQDDAEVYVNGVEITEGFEVVYPTTDNHTFDVVFEDLTAIESVEVGSKITVLYHSKLNDKAVLGHQGNINTVYGEYSNLHRPEYPGRTPDDTVIAFTYKVVVNKVDDQEDPQPLEGAEFTLEKFDAAENKWVAVDQVETESGTTFTFEGLDDGNYRLTETETPDGYNTIDPIYFTVTAEHEVEWEKWTPEQRVNVLTSLSGDKATGDTRVIEFKADKTAGSVSTDVVNQSGTILPETGGMGTTLFYIGGGIMVLAAVVLLVTKKRMMNAE